MVVLFKNEALERIYISGRESGKPRYGREIIRAFVKKIKILATAEDSTELVKFKSLHLEELKKEDRYKGMHSIRINDKFRIILKIVKEKDGNETIEIVNIYDLTDYH